MNDRHRLRYQDRKQFKQNYLQLASGQIVCRGPKGAKRRARKNERMKRTSFPSELVVFGSSRTNR